MTLTPNGYKKRIIDEEIKLMFGGSGAISLEGPKFCGKTWAALNASNSAIMLGDSSKNFQNKTLVEIDLDVAFKGEKPHLIDEWQSIPEIWDATKYNVDKTNLPGQFILTGSSTPMHKGILHSGAGRIDGIKMRTMSLFESGDSDGSVTLSQLFGGKIKTSAEKKSELENLIYLTVRGGWPQHIGLNGKICSAKMKSYVSKIIDDASVLDGAFNNKNKIAMVLKSLARNESTVTTNKKICSDIAEYENENVSCSSMEKYTDVLDRLFLIENQPSFSPNPRSGVRIGKMPKRHLADPSISVSALGMNENSLFNDLNTFGFMFEALCERDLDIYAKSLSGKLFHYRDANGLEIDSIIELDDRRYGAFEIKLGAKQIDDACRNLKKFEKTMMSDKIGRPPEFLCVICGMSDYAYCRKDGIYVVPITMLGPR